MAIIQISVLIHNNILERNIEPIFDRNLGQLDLLERDVKYLKIVVHL